MVIAGQMEEAVDEKLPERLMKRHTGLLCPAQRHVGIDDDVTEEDFLIRRDFSPRTPERERQNVRGGCLVPVPAVECFERRIIADEDAQLRVPEVQELKETACVLQ